MDNLSILKTIRKEAIETMKEKKILASFTIASAMYFMNTVSEDDAKKLIGANNFMKRKAGKKFNEDTIFIDSDRGVRYKSYDTVQDCINDWLLSFRSSIIKEVWDFDALINKLSNKEYTKANLQIYVDAYKLTDMDKKVLEEMYPPSQSIVEVDVLPTTTSTYQQLSGYKSVNTPIGKVSKRERPPKTPEKVTFDKGSKFVVRYANIYKDPGSSTPVRCFSGNVWVCNSNLINGRYAITTNKNNVNKGKDFIDGYIKKSDLG